MKLRLYTLLEVNIVMKKIKILFPILCTLIMLCGCSTNLTATPPVSDVVDNPFSQITEQENIQQGLVSIASYGLGYASNKELTITENIVTIPLELAGGAKGTQVGILVYLDGILQTYSTDNSEEELTMHLFDISAESKTTQPLYVNAVLDSSFKKHYINLVSVLLPEYRPENPDASFGTYHSGLTILPKELEIKGIETLLPYSNDILKSNDATVIKNSDIIKYGISEDSCASFVLFSDLNSDLNKKIYSDNGKLTLSLMSYTMQSDDNGIYRVSFYKSHQLVKINGEYEYIDVNLSREKISFNDIIIDNIKAGDFVYCVAVPLSNEGLEMPYKTKSVYVSVSDTPVESNISNESSKTDFTEDVSSTTQTTEGIEPSVTIVSSTEEETPVTESTSDVETSTLGVNKQVLFTYEDTLILAGFKGNDELYIYTSKDGKNIDKEAFISEGVIGIHRIRKTEDGYVILYYNSDLSISGNIYDKDFNCIKTIEFSKVLGYDPQLTSCELLDVNSNKICYTKNNGSELYVCDLNGNNNKMLIKLDSSQNNAATLIVGISLMEDGVAITANGRNDNKSIYFYGVTDFDGNYKLYQKYQKNKIQAPQTISNIAIWADTHLELTQTSSGEIVVYNNGKFTTINTITSNESQYAFLGDDGNSVLTYTEDFDNCSANITVYEDGVAVKRLYVNTDGVIGNNLVLFAGKIYANIIGDSYKLVCWDLR